MELLKDKEHNKQILEALDSVLAHEENNESKENTKSMIGNMLTRDLNVGDSFREFDSSGKEIPWRERKLAANGYAMALTQIYNNQDKYPINDVLSYTENQKKNYEQNKYGHYECVLNQKQIQRVWNCADWREYISVNDVTRLHKLSLCGRRFCPNCQAVQSRKELLLAVQTLERLTNQKASNGRMVNFRVEFLTFTLKNVNGDELREELVKMSNAFSRMYKDKRFGNQINSAMRVIEVTESKDGTYNQHIHALFYFKAGIVKGSKTGGSTGKNFGIVTQKEWVQLWKKYTGVDYEPMVHRVVLGSKKKKGYYEYKPTRGKNAGKVLRLTEKEMFVKQMAEMHKYSVKPDNIVKKDKDGKYVGNLKFIANVERAYAKIKATVYYGEFSKIRTAILKERREHKKEKAIELVSLVKMFEDKKFKKKYGGHYKKVYEKLTELRKATWFRVKWNSEKQDFLVDHIVKNVPIDKLESVIGDINYQDTLDKKHVPILYQYIEDEKQAIENEKRIKELMKTTK